MMSSNFEISNDLMMVIVRDYKTNKVLDSNVLKVGENFNVPDNVKVIKQELKGTVFTVWVKQKWDV